MAEEKTLGTHGAKWPKPPSEGVATYEKMLRTLMTPVSEVKPGSHITSYGSTTA